jgi:MraZ protein
MALGGLLCLFGIVLACKLRDSNKAVAQDESVAPPSIPVVPLPGGPTEDKSELPQPPPPQSNFTPAGPVQPVSAPAPTPAPGPLPPAPTPPVTRLGPPMDSAPQSVPTPPMTPNPTPAPTVGETRQPMLLVQPALPLHSPEQTRDVVPTRNDPNEPPLAPAPGPVQMYQVRYNTETLYEIARRTLGDSNRWVDIHKLNPTLRPDAVLAAGSVIRLPSDACIPGEEVEAVKPLPNLRPEQGPGKPKVVLPLTGTFPCNLDDKKTVLLPKAIREQLGNCDTVLISPGPDHCLWVTNQTHLERLAKRLENAPVHENVVRDFKRLYFAQTEKAVVGADGRIVVPDRLIQFADLHQEVVLVGIDDHFELWDVARWRAYTQQKSAASRSAMSEE